MARFIFRCTQKSCKHVYARDYSAKRVPMGYGRVTYRFERITDDARIFTPSNDSWCPACGLLSGVSKRVEGVKTDHQCDARCTNAKGHMCECSCGGKNHGASYLICEPVLTNVLS